WVWRLLLAWGAGIWPVNFLSGGFPKHEPRRKWGTSYRRCDRLVTSMRCLTRILPQVTNPDHGVHTVFINGLSRLHSLRKKSWCLSIWVVRRFSAASKSFIFVIPSRL